MKKQLFIVFVAIILMSTFLVLRQSTRPSKSIDRAIRLSGVKNMRDFGGLVTRSGQILRSGVLYRSDALHKATKKDLRKLEALKIKKVLDLRSNIELAQSPDKLPVGSVSLHRQLGLQSANPKAFTKNMLSGKWTSKSFRTFMINAYKLMAIEAKHILPQIIDDIINTSDGAVVFHCAGGKDRTGFISAILLMALGVDERTVIDDYMLTKKQRNKDYTKKAERMQKLAHVKLDPGLAKASAPHVEYIKAAIDEINKKYGGIEQYLTRYIGIPPYKVSALKARLLK